jgi:hypothetical protein
VRVPGVAGMRNCAWKILRGASDASTDSVMVGVFSPNTENDDNRTIAKQKKYLTQQREPVPISPPDYGFAANLVKSTIEYSSLSA